MFLEHLHAALPSCAIALAIVASTAQAQPETPPSASLAPSAAPAAEDEPAPATLSVAEKPASPVRLRFERGNYKPGIESLRVVRRENTINNVAGQVALNVAVSLLAGGVSIGGRSFSKDDLAGDAIEELKDDPVAVNPAVGDLNDALSDIATGIYRRRVATARETALHDGSTPEEVEEASQLPKEADTPLRPGAWHLVYEALAGSDELFRLRFGAELGRAGFMRPPAACTYQSEAIAWAEWKVDHWQRLRTERGKAVAQCIEILGATPEERW